MTTLAGYGRADLPLTIFNAT